MKKTVFMDKYPVYTLELLKSEMKVDSIDLVVSHFMKKIDEHPVAKFIALFDHYTHTKELNGPMVEGLKDAQNVIFCFGSAIPDTKILAARPRSIGICEFDDKYVVEFIEAPKNELNELMESWAKSLIK